MATKHLSAVHVTCAQFMTNNCSNGSTVTRSEPLCVLRSRVFIIHMIGFTVGKAISFIIHLNSWDLYCRGALCYIHYHI